MSAEARSAALLAVGDELVSGEQADRNSAFLAEGLLEHGWRVSEVVLLGDDEVRLARAMGELCARHGLVLTTGGLGPTLDDVTRHAAARAAGRALVLDGGALRAIGTWYAERGRPMPASNERQALFPAGAVSLANRAGTAPGFRLRVGEAWLVALPGPPREMRTVFERELAPWLVGLPAAGPVVRRRRLHLFGLTESDFADQVGAWMERDVEPRMGVLARAGVLTVKLEASAPDEVAALELLEHRAALLRARFKDLIFSEDRRDPAWAVGRELIARGLSLSVAESCTGGLVARKLCAVPGISAVFLEGFVPYSDRAKIERLGVCARLIETHGAVSGPVAEAMARGAAERSGARLAVATTGIAGPQGGSARKPVGLVWFGLCSQGRSESTERRFPPRGRGLVMEWAANTALDLVRRAMGSGGTPPGR